MKFILELEESEIDTILSALNSEVNFGEYNVLHFDSKPLNDLRTNIICQQAVPRFIRSFVVSGTYDNGAEISEIELLVFADTEEHAREIATEHLERSSDDLFVIDSIRLSNEDDIFLRKTTSRGA